MKLVLATNNDDKVREMANLLADLPVTLLSRRDFTSFPDPEETGHTLAENAIIKARAITVFSKLPALADDTGLEVDVLDGAPGVFSSRFAGPQATYSDNCRKLVAALRGVEEPKRTASFRCVIAIAWDELSVETVEGRVDGCITEEPSGSSGFGYDPVFFHPPTGKRFSEMTVAEKNAISHRGIALRKARELIITRLHSHT